MDVEVLGRTLRLAVDTETHAWIEDNWIGPTRVPDPPLPQVVSSSFAITVGATPEPVPRAVSERAADLDTPGTRHLRLGGDAFWILDPTGSCGVLGQLSDEGAQLEVFGAPFRAWLALRFALAEALGASGIVSLHTAAVTDGTRTLALLGPTGRGKSTTLIRAVAAGWRPIAEDTCFLDLNNLTLVGGDRHVRARVESAGSLRAAGFEPGPVVDGRHEIAYEALGGRVPAATLTDLVRIVRTADPTPSWHPLRSSDAVMALHEGAGIPNTARVGAVVAVGFGAVAQRCRRATLGLGDPTRPFPAYA